MLRLHALDGGQILHEQLDAAGELPAPELVLRPPRLRSVSKLHDLVSVRQATKAEDVLQRPPLPGTPARPPCFACCPLPGTPLPPPAAGNSGQYCVNATAVLCSEQVAGRGAGGGQTSPEEIAFRWQGLTSWMEKGLGWWWFDHNWCVHACEVPLSLSPSVWARVLCVLICLLLIASPQALLHPATIRRGIVLPVRRLLGGKQQLQQRHLGGVGQCRLG